MSVPKLFHMVDTCRQHPACCSSPNPAGQEPSDEANEIDYQAIHPIRQWHSVRRMSMVWKACLPSAGSVKSGLSLRDSRSEPGLQEDGGQCSLFVISDDFHTIRE